MAEVTQVPTEISPGLFELDSLQKFEMSEAWELTSIYNTVNFGDEGNPYKVFQVDNRHGSSGDTDFVFTNLVLGMGFLKTTSHIMEQESLNRLKATTIENKETGAAFGVIQNALDNKRNSWQQTHRQRMAEIIVNKREHLHVLTGRKDHADNRITGFFGKLWGITVADMDKNGFEIYEPVIIGKDQQPVIAKVDQHSSWLYNGTLE